MHGYVEPISVAIFEHQKFATLTADFHHLQADVAADAVLLVHHRCAGAQGLQVAQDGVGVGGDFAPSTLLSRPRAEELRLREYGERRVGERKAGELGGYGQSERGARLDEGLPALDGGGTKLRTTQQFAEHFAPSRRVGGEQHSSRVRGEKSLQGRERFFGARIEAQFLRQARAVVPMVGRRCFATKGVDHDTAVTGDTRVHCAGIDEEFLGSQQRPLDVTAALLVARRQSLPSTLDRAVEAAREIDDDGIGGQVIKDSIGRLEEQRQVELDTGGGDPVAHATVDHAARRVAFETGAVTSAEGTYRIGIERHLARGQQTHGRERVLRALRLRVEAAYRLDLIVEQIDAKGGLGAHRKDIE